MSFYRLRNPVERNIYIRSGRSPEEITHAKRRAAIAHPILVWAILSLCFGGSFMVLITHAMDHQRPICERCY